MKNGRDSYDYFMTLKHSKVEMDDNKSLAKHFWWRWNYCNREHQSQNFMFYWKRWEHLTAKKKTVWTTLKIIGRWNNFHSDSPITNHKFFPVKVFHCLNNTLIHGLSHLHFWMKEVSWFSYQNAFELMRTYMIFTYLYLSVCLISYS